MDRREAHYRRMAQATAELADWTDEPDIAAAYRAIADHWEQRASGEGARVAEPA